MIPEQRHSGSAGTAGAGYRCDEDRHPYRAATVDPGERERCMCGRELRQHVGVAAR